MAIYRTILRAGECRVLESVAPLAMQWVGMPDGGQCLVQGAFQCLLFVLRGKARTRSVEGVLELGARKVLVLDRDSHAHVDVSRGGDCGLLVLGNDWSRLAGKGHAAGGLTPRVDKLLRQDLRTMSLLRKWEETPDFFRSSQESTAAEYLLRRWGGAGDEAMLNCPGRSASRRQSVLVRMHRARLFLEGNADRVVRVPELARLTHFSPWYFTKTFHRVFGVTPQQCGVRIRLRRAARLVRDTDLAVGEIAAACGFENACSFARAFQNQFGLSATRMRIELASKGHCMDWARAAAKVGKASSVQAF